MKGGVYPFFCGLLLLALLVCGCSSPPTDSGSTLTQAHNTTTGIPRGPGHYIFLDLLGNADRPITIYTYRPAGWNTTGPILIVMHGAGRDGASCRDIWIPYSERYSALLIAPEFSSQNYPGDFWYIGGNMFSERGIANNRSNWTFTAIEHIFDDVCVRSGATQQAYLLFGHSAGAQFVHRMVIFLPGARYSRAAAANAGLYILPDFTVNFPFGLKGSPLPESNLSVVFSRKLIIMSGEADTNPNDSSLVNFPEAEAQGRTRFDRARYFIDTARREADRHHLPLAWQYHTVPGVGHDEAGMAGPSAGELFKQI